MSEFAWRIEQREDQREFGKGTLIIGPCPSLGHECRIPLWANAPVDNGGARMWQWNGSVERPTVTPSVHCVRCIRGTDRDATGCGRHFTLSEGVVHGC